MIRPALFAALALNLCIGIAAQAQDFSFTRADVSEVVGNPITTDAATLRDEPFWTAVAPFVGQHGFCQRPGDDTVMRMPLEEGSEGAAFNIELAPATLARIGFKRSFEWMTQQGFYPFDTFVIESKDPRAPSVVPVFCTTTPMPEDSQLRPDYFDFATIDNLDTYFYLSRRIGAEGGGADVAEYDTNRVLLSAIRRALDLYFYDQNNKLFAEGATYFGGGDASSLDQAEDRQWFYFGLLDALAVHVFEEKQGPKFDDFDRNYERLTYLYGDIDDTFTIIRQTEGDETTTGGFFYFLLGDYLGDRYDLVPEMLRMFYQEDNLLDGLDKLIDAHDGEYFTGLENALPAYAAYALDWPERRFNNNISNEKWRETAYSGCKELKVNEVEPSASIEVEIAPYSSICIRARIASVGQSWHGDGQFRMQVSDGTLSYERIDDVYLSAAKWPGTISGHTSCHHFISESKGSAVDCLMVPRQGRDADGVLQRYLTHFLETDFDPGYGYDEYYVATYVPSKHAPGDGTGYKPLKVEITYALDLIETEGSALLDLATAAVNYASKSDFAPVSEPATEKADNLSDGVLDGRAIAIDPNSFQSVMPFADDSLGLTDENGTGIGVQFEDPTVLSGQKTGTFDVIPVFQKDGLIAQPDTSKPSKITIITHDQDTLHFEIEANLCMAEISELPALIQAQVPDFCLKGRKETVKTRATVSYPETFRSDGQLAPAPTENYQALRELRLARIKGLVPTVGRSAALNAADSTDAATIRDALSGVNSTGGGRAELQCKVLDAGGGCDCSCRSKTCASQKLASNSILPAEKACRLTCGKKWKACSCSIPDDHIDPRRSALFMARSILNEVRDGRSAC